MSARRLVEVSCNGPAAGGDCPDSAGWSCSTTAEQLRQRMREDGWAVGLPGGVDRCPSCRTYPQPISTT